MDKKNDFLLELYPEEAPTSEKAAQQVPPKEDEDGLLTLEKEALIPNTAPPIPPQAPPFPPVGAKPVGSSAADKAAATDNALTVTLLQELVSLLRPKPFRKRRPIIFWGGILCIIGIIWLAVTGEGSSLGGERIAVVRVEGAIMETKPTLEWIRTLEHADHVKGVLLRIDSPGGGAAASQEIYSALLALGKKKPIVASMGSAAASGGLMVAMAAQYIVANPSTITGSIGVRMDIPQIYKLMESIGVGQESLTTGKFKDAGSMMRALSPEDRAYFQGVMDDLYGQFVAMVAEGRKKPVEDIQKIADGRIFTGREALHLGIVDALGGQDLALSELYSLTNVDPLADLYEDRNLEKEYGALFGSLWRSLLQSVSFAESQGSVFLYK